ncbi:MAG: gliding motility-associated C-terminal domain-containing protein, partial [Cytophagales bacterium]|nr:gliding motility-associated C-terminal domain-containing protein [Cytophagales bacterium]
KKQVIVKPKPRADFVVATDNNSQQAGTPIDFTDLTSSLDNIIEWNWKFTKRDSTIYLTKTNPSFTFDTISIFDVRQIVRNTQGCTDTVTARVDLNAYLILPTAFSPNNDNQNDQLYLLYKGIKSLKEFKIYNRFGEKVFDGGNNLDAIWDGTQNGQPSPVGSYVYYVVAGTNYGKDIAKKGQLTLIR